jgi:hypothetical protein
LRVCHPLPQCHWAVRSTWALSLSLGHCCNLYLLLLLSLLLLLLLLLFLHFIVLGGDTGHKANMPYVWRSVVHGGRLFIYCCLPALLAMDKCFWSKCLPESPMYNTHLNLALHGQACDLSRALAGCLDDKCKCRFGPNLV